MAVYVDPAIWNWRGRTWCHLRADNLEELHEFAALLGLPRNWLQRKSGQPWKDHYDIPSEYRLQAIALGAMPISVKESALLTRRLKAEHAQLPLES